MNEALLITILADIDIANSADPNTESWGEATHPKELLYGHRMSSWLSELRADADEALQIAARAQHICRWEHPRESYPMDRRGYLAWRRDLYTFHAEKVGAIIEKNGGAPDLVDRVSFLLHKKQIHDDADTQTLEDCACLVFLEFHMDEFARKTEHDKLINIVRKTWGKMSPQGHAAAMNMIYSDAVQAVLSEALGES